MRYRCQIIWYSIIIVLALGNFRILTVLAAKENVIIPIVPIMGVMKAKGVPHFVYHRIQSSAPHSK